MGSALPLSLRPLGRLRPGRPKAEPSRDRGPAGTRVPPWPGDAAAPPSTPEEGDGEEPVHVPGSREEAAAGACAPSPRRLGRRGARAPSSRAHARPLARSPAPARGFPARAPGRSHSGACARALGPTRVARFPGLRGPRRPASGLPANSSPPFPRGMGPALLGVARPGPGSRSVSRRQPLPGSRRLALSLSQWRRRLR